MATGSAALRVIVLVLGILLLGGALTSLIRTFVVPKALASAIGHASRLIVYSTLWSIARRRRDYFDRDTVLAWVGPLIILADLLILTACFVVAYGMILFGMSELSLLESLYQAGSNLFTLGIVEPSGYSQDVVIFLAAFTGLTVIALLIGTLTTIYSMYVKREVRVSALSLMAGAPAWGPELLCRISLSDDVQSLGGTYAEWAKWAAQVRLTQTVYPQMNHFRSPSGRQHWVVALLAVMDAAALQVALSRDAPRKDAMTLLTEGSRTLAVLQPPHLVDHSKRRSPGAAADLVRGPEEGLTTVRRAIAADAARADRDTPEKGAVEFERRASTMHREEFDYAVSLLERAGFPITEHPNPAWLVFQHLREEYEYPAYALANELHAPPAPWSGPRIPETDVLWPSRSAELGPG